MKELEWERIEEDMVRTKVPGGWLVREFIQCGGYSDSPFTSSLCYIPDPLYEWLK